MSAANYEPKKDEKVKIITEVFRPYLVECLDVTDIIMDMKKFFGKDDGSDAMFEEVLEKSLNNSPRRHVTEEFLRILDEKGDQQGLFKGFKDALEKSDPDLMNCLDGVCVSDTKRREHYLYFLKLYASELQKIDVKDILPHLADGITSRDEEEIRTKCTNHGSLAGAMELFLRLHRKSERCFDLLVHGLEISGHEELARNMRQERNFVLDIEDMDTSENDDGSSVMSNMTTYHIDNKTNAINDDDDDDEAESELNLRDYQEEVAVPALNGKNSMVILPTGTGKTEVAIAVIQRRFLISPLDQQGAINHPKKKVVFVVNKVPLVTQQRARCLKYLRRQCRVIGVSSEELSQTPLASVIDSHDITILTAQILVNALRDEQSGLKLSHIDLLILDECHHCQKSDPYNTLMAMYRDLKLVRSKEPRPQILGLTASPGVGEAKNKLQAKEHILNLCANLDCSISQVTEHARIIQHKTVSPKEIELIVKGRSVSDPYFREISLMMEEIERKMLESEEGRRVASEEPQFSKMSSQRGCQSYEQVVVNIKKKISQTVEKDSDLMSLMACVDFLREYNNSLYVNRDCRTKDAIEYMVEYVKQQDRPYPSGATDIWLIKMFNDKLPILRKLLELQVSRNPVLNELGKVLKKEYREKPDSLAIVFTRTRESATAMVKWLNEDQELKRLNADFLTGGGNQGMTSSVQSTKLQLFKDGNCKLLISTSVAEEGLDIQACNLVIRYNYVTSDIGHIQTKGRGRAADAKVYLIVNAGLQLQDRELRNMIRVKMMEEAVYSITKMGSTVFWDEILFRQEEDRKGREMEKKKREALNANRTEMPDINFHCCKCFEIGCVSGDIRSISDQHHVVCNDHFAEKVTLVPLKKQPLIDGFHYRDEILCRKCQKKWGSMVKYRGNELPLIAVKNFTLKRGERKWLPRRWKDVPFVVTNISSEDLVRQGTDSHSNLEMEGEDDNVLLEYSNITTVD